jgi:hypothetical protein
MFPHHPDTERSVLPATRHPWYQFSLKRLLLIVACVAVMCAIVGEFVHSDWYARHPYWQEMWFALPIMRPHCLAALGATIGAIFGRLWFWLGLGLGSAGSALVYWTFYVAVFP